MADQASYKTTSLGYPINFKGPGSVEDYDRAAGKVGACLEDANENEIYRGTLPEWQAKFGKEVLVPRFGERQVNQKATDAAKARSKTPDKVENILETWTRYHSRVTADLSKEEKAALAAEAQRIADSITIDPSPSSRAKGPAKAFLAKADEILTRDENGIEAAVEKLLSVLPDFQLERDDKGTPDRSSLARMIEEYTNASI